MRSLLALGQLATRIPRAARLIRQLKPDVIVGTGGYVSATILYAATRLRIPTVILDLNAVPGRTTRWLAPRLTRIAIAFEGARQFLPAATVVLTGVPVRKAVIEKDSQTARDSLGIGGDQKMLLVFGGSQAAHRINLATFGAVAPLLGRFDNIHVFHLCGESDLPTALDTGKSLELSQQDRYHPIAYCHQMENLLTAADLVVSRAGGSSIGELTARGIPAILVPYPYATDNHQEANAREVESAGGAKVLLDSDLTAEAFLRETTTLLGDEGNLQQMRDASRHFGRPDAAAKVVELAESLIA